jgi:hypothetical protein
MRCLKSLDTWSGGGWGVFIAPTTKPTIGEVVCRWAHWIVRCATGHCPVRQPRHPTVTVLTVSTIGALTSWGIGQSGAAPNKHCSLSGAPSGAALTLRELPAHCSRCRRPLELTIALNSRCSAGTLDSSVNYSGAALQKPKVKSLSRSPLGHRTLSGGTQDSPVRQTRVFFGFFAPFF